MKGNRKFGQILRDAMEMDGLEQIDLSNLTGISLTTVNGYYKGRRFPGETNYDLIASEVPSLPFESRDTFLHFYSQQKTI